MTDDIVKRQRTVPTAQLLTNFKWQREIPRKLLDATTFDKFDDEGVTEIGCAVRVDEFCFFLSWKSASREGRVIDICNIFEVRVGANVKVPAELEARGKGPAEARLIVVVHGDNLVNVNNTYFLAPGIEAAKEWAADFRSILLNKKALHVSPFTLIKKCWMRFRLESTASGKVPVKQIHKFYGSGKQDRHITQALKACDLPTSAKDEIDLALFTFEKFHEMHLKIVPRNDIQDLFKSITKGKDVMKVEQLMDFLNSVQRDPRLNELLYPKANKAAVGQLIQAYEEDEKFKQMELFDLEGFYRFLTSDDNSPVMLDALEMSQDLDQPLCHYFISSSHNTYLPGRQFGGKSSVEIYRQVLASGCRSIEIDCWDGKGDDAEPVVTHGKAMTTEVLLRDVIVAVAETAFLANDYPLIISFENHLSKPQQYKMAKYLEDICGDLLLKKPLESHRLEPGSPLPSPNLLKRKILVKNKRLRPDVEAELLDLFLKGQDLTTDAVAEGAEGLHAADGDTDPNAIPPPQPAEGAAPADGNAAVAPTTTNYQTSVAAIHPYLSQFVNYTQAVKFIGFDISEERNIHYQMSSFNEVVGVGHIKQSAIEFVNYNKRQLSRIYPKGARVDSSNYLPQIFWNAGCQLVALNFQTPDLSMQLNMGKFEYNGNIGYLLKPDFMRRNDRLFDPFAESPVDGVVAATCSIQIISGYFLTDKKVGVFVEVEMYGLPTDTIRKEFRTKVVPQNGLNPVFNEEPFVFRKVVLPDLALVRFVVNDETGKLLAQRVIPLDYLKPGYRHITLRNESGFPLGLATLFVKIELKSYVPESLGGFVDALSNPTAYQSLAEKRAKAMQNMGIDEGDLFGDLKKNNAKKPGANPPGNPMRQDQATVPSATQKKEETLNFDISVATLKQHADFIRLERRQHRDLESLKRAQTKERLSMHKAHCVAVDRLLSNMRTRRTSAAAAAAASGSGAANGSAGKTQLEQLVDQQEQSVRDLVEQQTKEWSALLAKHLQTEYELKTAQLREQLEPLKAILDEVYQEKKREVEAKKAQELKELNTTQSKSSITATKAIMHDKSIPNRAERERRVREMHENNTKKFIEERKRLVMKHALVLEKLEKANSQLTHELEKCNALELHSSKIIYEEMKLAAKPEATI